MKNDLMQGVEYSHFLIQKHINKGSTVIDATAGNGNDTVFLARQVGKEGYVFAFDIQKKAVNNTVLKLEKYNLQKRVKVINDGHENMEQYVQEPVAGIIFNLGYLPGSDKRIITTSETTITAVKQGIKLIVEEGLIVLVIYTGHSGGKSEHDRLIKFCSKLDDSMFNVLHYHFINQKNNPACVLAIKKRKIYGG